VLKHHEIRDQDDCKTNKNMNSQTLQKQTKNPTNQPKNNTQTTNKTTKKHAISFRALVLKSETTKQSANPQALSLLLPAKSSQNTFILPKLFPSANGQKFQRDKASCCLPQ